MAQRGVDDQVLFLIDGRLTQLTRPLAGIRMGVRGPGVGMFGAEPGNAWMKIAQLIRVNGHSIVGKLTLSRVREAPFSCAGLTRQDDRLRVQLARRFVETAAWDYFFGKYLGVCGRIEASAWICTGPTHFTTLSGASK